MAVAPAASGCPETPKQPCHSERSEKSRSVSVGSRKKDEGKILQSSGPTAVLVGWERVEALPFLFFHFSYMIFRKPTNLSLASQRN